jgi:hypothetical protein
MNRSRFSLLVILCLVLVASALYPDARAMALSRADTKITWKYVYNQTVHPGGSWWSKFGYHVRDRVDIGYAHGDIEGAVKVVYNGDFYQRHITGSRADVPLSGRAYGTIEIRETASGMTGKDGVATWAGAWSYDIRDGVIVSGRLWAVHAEAPQMMIIDKVWQTGHDIIVHAGFIDQVYCLDTICPGSGDQ